MMKPDTAIDTEPVQVAQNAYSHLFPKSQSTYLFNVVYTGRIKDYGAYITQSGSNIEFRMSRKWYPVSSDIQMGMMQELLLKLFKKKKQSIYVDLYNNFVRNLHLAIPKDNIDPVLEASFNRVNEKYFLGLVEIPNLRWGRFSTTTFGSYDFKTDTVTMSRVFEDAEDKYLDYVMFHEILHKQRKFFKSGSRTYYHDRRFKRLEKVFEDSDRIDKELVTIAAKAKASRKKIRSRPKKSGRKIFDWF